MNRAKRRDFIKIAQKKGISKEFAEAYMAMKGETGDGEEIKDGDKVLLNVDRIKKGKNYKEGNPKYKQFVEENVGTVFTARIEKGGLYELEEEPYWLFYKADIMLFKEELNNDAKED